MEIKSKSVQALFWLGLATLLSFLAGGDTPVELALWLGPVFWLKFFRMSKPLKGYLMALPCMVLADFLSSRGMSPPMPLSVVIIMTIISYAVLLLPYLLDRLLAPKLPGGIRTLLLPTFVVAVYFLFFLTGRAGTWGSPAYGINDIVWLQLVSITGIWGITFLIYWTAAVINEAWSNLRNIKEIRKLLISFSMILIVVYGYGVFRLHESKPIKNSVRAAGITPTHSQREKLSSTFRQIISKNIPTEDQIKTIRADMEQLFMDLLERSMKSADSGIDIVAWSEGAVGMFSGDEERYIQRARLAAKEHGVYLGIASVVIMENLSDLMKHSQPFAKNKLIFILPDGSIAWEHMKATLVPGYEDIFTIPGDGILKNVNIPIIPRGPVTGAICYELDFPQLIRQAGRSGSSLLLAPANDWAEIKHTHAAMARLRAIENGLAIIRPTSQGFSIAVDPYGRIVSQADYFQHKEGTMTAVLPVKHISTVYSWIGDLFAWLLLILTPLGVTAIIIRDKRQRKL